MRKFIRSWLSFKNVPEAEADAFVGHADEGSATGRKFYKASREDYMTHAVRAIEALYDALRPLVFFPFAGTPELVDQPSPSDVDALLMSLAGAERGRSVEKNAITS
jgi:hypothetical protein